MLSYALVALLAMPAGKAADPALVGSWGLGGHALFTLKADGTGTMEEDAVSWRADGKRLVIGFEDGEKESMPYTLAGGQLNVTMSGTPLVLQRIGAPPAADRSPAPESAGAARSPSGAAASPAGATRNTPAKDTPAKAPPAQAGNKDPLSQLLLSSAWCYLHYSQVSGSTSTERVQFFPDGTWSNGARYEGYSSGSGGTFSSQHDSGGQGRWESRAGGDELWMSSGETGGQLVRLPLSITRNSNGYPILTGNGKEYSMCK